MRCGPHPSYTGGVCQGILKLTLPILWHRWTWLLKINLNDEKTMTGLTHMTRDSRRVLTLATRPVVSSSHIRTDFNGIRCPDYIFFKTENVWSLVEIVTQDSGTRHCSSHNAPWVGSEKRYPMISYRTRSEHLVFRKKNILSSFSAKARVSYEVCVTLSNIPYFQHDTRWVVF